MGTDPEDPDSKVHGANMGPIWGRQDPGGPQVGPMNFAIGWIFFQYWYGTNLQVQFLFWFFNESLIPTGGT